MKWVLILMVFGPGSGNVSTVGDFVSEADCAHTAVAVATRALETAEKVPGGKGIWHIHVICQPVRTEAVKPAPQTSPMRRTS